MTWTLGHSPFMYCSYALCLNYGEVIAHKAQLLTRVLQTTWARFRRVPVRTEQCRRLAPLQRVCFGSPAIRLLLYIYLWQLRTLPREVNESSESSWPGWAVYLGRNTVAPGSKANLIRSGRKLLAYKQGLDNSVHIYLHCCFPAPLSLI